MSSAGGGGQNQQDQLGTFFWLSVSIVGAVVLIWLARPQWIIVPIFKIRLAELDIFSFFVHMWVDILGWFNLPAPSTTYMDNIHNMLLSTTPKLLKFQQFTQINLLFGKWVRYPVTIILMLTAAYIAFRHTGVKFRNSYSMDSLKKAEKNNWPQISPVIEMDLVKQDLEKGPWAMAQTPINFCKKRDLLVVQKKNDQTVYGLKADKAYQVICLQVGRHYKGINALPIHAKALMVIFLARATRKRETSNRFLTQIAGSAASGKLDFTGVEDALDQFKNERIISWAAQRHSYTYTLLATMLEIARSDGVLATSEFLWLKPVDRGLWYILNSVGRQTAVIEAAGSFAHWLAEKRIGRGVKTPMVKEAINALVKEVENILHIDESGLWRSNAA